MYGKEEKKGRRKLKIRGKALAKCKGKQKKKKWEGWIAYLTVAMI